MSSGKNQYVVRHGDKWGVRGALWDNRFILNPIHQMPGLNTA
jgi:hypothetical protein